MNERKEILEIELQNVLKNLVKFYNPDKIILFGSMVDGEIKSFSDIDLVVIKEIKEKFWERLINISKFLSRKVGMDILVYTPDEFDYLCQNRRFFKREILQKGKIIYERR